MKLISLVALIWVLHCSRQWVMQPTPVPEAVHIQIQNELKNFIAESLKSMDPNIENLIFQTLYTENQASDSHLRAQFGYSFTKASPHDSATDVSGTTHVEGYAEFQRNKLGKWEGRIHVTGSDLEFDEPLTIDSASPDTAQ